MIDRLSYGAIMRAERLMCFCIKYDIGNRVKIC